MHLPHAWTLWTDTKFTDPIYACASVCVVQRCLWVGVYFRYVYVCVCVCVCVSLVVCAHWVCFWTVCVCAASAWISLCVCYTVTQSIASCVQHLYTYYSFGLQGAPEYWVLQTYLMFLFLSVWGWERQRGCVGLRGWVGLQLDCMRGWVGLQLDRMPAQQHFSLLFVAWLKG